MEFGAHLFGVGAMADPRALVEATRLAEDAGYHSVFLADHVLVPRGLQSKYPYSRDGSFKVLQRLEQIATEMIKPFQRG